MATDKDEIRAQYKRDFEDSLSVCETFYEKITEIMKKKHWNTAIFCERTGLNKTVLSDIKSAKGKTTIRIAISICVGFGLNISKTEEMLRYAGLSFIMTDPVHFKYYYLITHYQRIGIVNGNKLLRILGMEQKDLLGSQEKASRVG